MSSFLSKFMILFGKPETPGEFEDVYNDFFALVEKMPHINRRQVIDILGSPVGETQLFRILEIYFDDRGQMETALTSPAGQKAGRELARLPAGSFEMVFAEVYEEAGGRTPTGASGGR